MKNHPFAIFFAVAMLSFTTFCGIQIYRGVYSPEAKARLATEKLQRETESLFSGSARGTTTTMIVVTRPQRFSSDGRISILRAKISDGVPQMVFYYYSSEDVQSLCSNRHIPPLLGESIQVRTIYFRANEVWTAPIGGVIPQDENSILFATPSKCE